MDVTTVRPLAGGDGAGAPRARFHTVSVGGLRFDRAEFQPGWRWSRDLAGEGEASCRVRHVGLILAGALRVRMDDGSVHDLHAGDAYAIEPGHDTWTLGDEACVAVDISADGDAG